MRMKLRLLMILTCVLCTLCVARVGFSTSIKDGGASPTLQYARQAKRILDATGVKGGIIVHLGCGDGKLTADGLADVTGWPAPSTEGIGFHGGPWYGDNVRLQVSDRFLAVCLRPQRSEAYGFRGVRQAP